MKHLLPIFALSLLLCGCYSPYDKAKRVISTNGDSFTVDTILVHNKPHEVIRDGSPHRFGGMMHSPECWCKEKGE